MALVGSATCTRCGASFAGGVARCPFCGASVDAVAKPAEPPPSPLVASPLVAPPLAPEPPLVPPPDRVSVRTRPEVPAKKQPNWVLPAAAAGILGAGALAILLLSKGAPPPSPPPVAALVPSPVPPPAQSAPPSRNEPFTDPARVDPSDLYPKVKQRALAWNADARLVSLTASPVVGDKVDLTQAGAEVVYIFQADSTARTAPLGHLAVTVRRGGIEQGPLGPYARIGGFLRVAEPNCVFDAAAKAAHASGIPAATVMKLRYESDPELKRGVWTARGANKADLDRVIDGQTCNIVVRRPAKSGRP